MDSHVGSSKQVESNSILRNALNEPIPGRHPLGRLGSRVVASPDDCSDRRIPPTAALRNSSKIVSSSKRSVAPEKSNLSKLNPKIRQAVEETDALAGELVAACFSIGVSGNTDSKRDAARRFCNASEAVIAAAKSVTKNAPLVNGKGLGYAEVIAARLACNLGVLSAEDRAKLLEGLSEVERTFPHNSQEILECLDLVRRAFGKSGQDTLASASSDDVNNNNSKLRPSETGTATTTTSITSTTNTTSTSQDNNSLAPNGVKHPHEVNELQARVGRLVRGLADAKGPSVARAAFAEAADSVGAQEDVVRKHTKGVRGLKTLVWDLGRFVDRDMQNSLRKLDQADWMAVRQNCEAVRTDPNAAKSSKKWLVRVEDAMKVVAAEKRSSSLDLIGKAAPTFKKSIEEAFGGKSAKLDWTTAERLRRKLETSAEKVIQEGKLGDLNDSQKRELKSSLIKETLARLASETGIEAVQPGITALIPQLPLSFLWQLDVAAPMAGLEGEAESKAMVRSIGWQAMAKGQGAYGTLATAFEKALDNEGSIASNPQAVAETIVELAGCWKSVVEQFNAREQLDGASDSTRTAEFWETMYKTLSNQIQPLVRRLLEDRTGLETLDDNTLSDLASSVEQLQLYMDSNVALFVLNERKRAITDAKDVDASAQRGRDLSSPEDRGPQVRAAVPKTAGWYDGRLAAQVHQNAYPSPNDAKMETVMPRSDLGQATQLKARFGFASVEDAMNLTEAELKSSYFRVRGAVPSSEVHRLFEFLMEVVALKRESSPEAARAKAGAILRDYFGDDGKLKLTVSIRQTEEGIWTRKALQAVVALPSGVPNSDMVNDACIGAQMLVTESIESAIRGH